MRLLIKSLTISHFKGISSPLTINFNTSGITSVYGANHSGKTTTMDAVMWLLFGKNSQGETNFGIDPLDDDGNIIHNLDNSVKATFLTEGREITLQRIRKEVWKKVRGEETENYTHTTAFFVDGQKYTEKEYKLFISDSIITENVFRAVTNPGYFPSLPPKEQRNLLIQMVGNITDDDVVEHRPDLRKILDEMSGMDIEEYNKHIAYKIREIKNELATLPAKISENKSYLMNAKDFLKENMAEESINADIKSHTEKIEHCNQLIADISKAVDIKGETLRNLRQELNAKKAEAQNIKNEIDRENRRSREDHQYNLQRIRQLATAARQEKTYAEQQRDNYTNKRSHIEIQKIDFRKRWQEVENMSFHWDDTSENCPTCGQRLPQENIDAQKVIAQKQFNDRKQRMQNQLDQEAKVIKDGEAQINATMAEIEAAIAKHNDNIESAQQRIEQEENKEITLVAYTDNNDYNSLFNAITQLQVRIKSEEAKTISTDNSEVRAEAERQRTEITNQRDMLRDMLAQRKQVEKNKLQYQQRIKELTEREQEVNRQLADMERREDMARDFQLTRIAILQRRVNGMFTVVKFNMFKKLMNGNLEPTCECTMHGTPYRDLSNSERINAGLDITAAISKYNDCYAPVFIDNAESSTHILETENQQVRLYVSTDRELVTVNG